MSLNNSIMSFGGILKEQNEEFKNSQILNTVYSGPVTGGKLV